MSRHFYRETEEQREQVTGADTVTINAAFLNLTTGIPRFEIDGDNIAIHARFNQASDSLTFILVVTWEDPAGVETLIGVSDEVTLTAGVARDTDGRYLSPIYVHPSFGGRYGRLLVKVPGAAAADLWAGSY